jgi:hypothetical protein
MKRGRKNDVQPGRFPALRRRQQRIAVLVYVNGFGNFRVPQKKFFVPQATLLTRYRTVFAEL